METTFENARIGDRVWCPLYGWGEIVMIYKNSNFPISVSFKIGINGTYTFKGEYMENGPQSLFWDEVKIVAPPRPKRKVRKVIDKWVNIYRYGISDFFNSPKEADSFQLDGRLGPAYHIIHEYEEEEEP